MFSHTSFVIILVTLFSKHVISSDQNVKELNLGDADALGILTPGLFPGLAFVLIKDHSYSKSYGKPYDAKPYDQSYDKSKPYDLSYDKSKPYDLSYDKSYTKPYDKLAYDTTYSSHCSNNLNYCVGYILNNRFVIIAANCTLTAYEKQRPLDSYSVRVGVDTLSDDPTNITTVYQVEQVFVNPDYNPSQSGNTANVAILKLKDPIHFTPYVKEACLDFETDFLDALILIGYGVIPELNPTRRYGKYIGASEAPRAKCKDTEVCAFPLPYTTSGLISCDSPYGATLNTPMRDGVGLLAPEIEGQDPCHALARFIRLSSNKDFIDKILGGEDQYCRKKV